ncbi:ABC transporter ATP-binding protein [uncultured Clostridium sp.]|uniref:ABC transporter ATP-binding protein n=1 Tax=uncultured Clostridium sp. TaxID=59620 RepID=UPI0025E9C5B0|nr:ABC transporter ATP-binding protein [uncultured Clostridium sp.]
MKKTKKLYICMALNVLEGLLSGANFTVLYFVIKDMLAGALEKENLMKYAFMLGGIFVLRLVIYSIAYTGGHIAGAQITERIRMFLGNKLKKIPLSKFTKAKTGQYINAVTANVTNYENILTHKAGDIVKNITLISMLIVFMAIMYPAGGLIVLIAALIMFPALYISSMMVKKYGTEKSDTVTENVSNVVEYVTGIQTFRAYGLCGTKNKAVTDSMKNYSDVSYKYEAKVIPVGAVQAVIVGLCMPAIIIAGQHSLQKGSVNIVILIMEIMIPIFACKLMASIFMDFTSYKNLIISKKAIEEVADEVEEVENDRQFEPDDYNIVFKNVSFGYEENERVLKNISFTAGDGKLTAIVGDSGSGKSTILNMISKYYEPQEGKITIGDIEINNIESTKVLDKIALVDQDVFLFNDTIKNNIRYAREDASDAEVIHACKEANCHEFIKKMKDGYDTCVGENGNALSGGERQRLSIARAILKDSPILLLDEATASLDIENEIAVKQAIFNLLKKKKTVIMIAHTLSIVQNADKIIVVSNGQIIEEGTHDELILNKGKYYKMWSAEKELYK